MRQGLQSLDDFLAQFEQHTNFAYTKINHGFWEGLAEAYAAVGRPVPPDQCKAADRAATRPFFFEGGFVDELLWLLQQAGRTRDPALFFGVGLSAWPGDGRILGTPADPASSEPVIEGYRRLFGGETDGLLLKRAVMDGGILRLFERLRAMRVIVVGPEAVRPLGAAAGFEEATHLAIDARQARRTRDETEQALTELLDAPCSRETCVLMQAGTLAPFWILRLRARYPEVRFIDGGLALSIAQPRDLLSRPWGKAYREEILETHERLVGVRGTSSFARQPRLPYIEAGRQALLSESTGQEPPRSGHPRRVAFVEDKALDIERTAELLQPARERNHWSNYGPAWSLLQSAYHRYMAQPDTREVIPCANGGMALEALAALHACKKGRPLRWAVSAFGFTNSARGAFADALVVDTDKHGLISLAALSTLPTDSYDGFVVTNPYGLARDFDACAKFARDHDKVMLLDNAAGVSAQLPDVDYQSFSLHQTKAHGFGEGGLAVAPAEESELLLSLLGYGPLESEFARFWVGNGKLSELSCAGHLQRLECTPQWVPLYEMQSQRIQDLAARAGLQMLLPDLGPAVSTSLPLLAPHPVAIADLSNPFFVVGKFYRPLAPRPTTTAIYDHLLNVPSHPDMRHVDSDDLLAVLTGFVQQRQAA